MRRKPPTGIEPVTSRLQITRESAREGATGPKEGEDAAHALRAAVEAWLEKCPVELDVQRASTIIESILMGRLEASE